MERGQRLRSLVTDTEWESLERSRLNAFFTSPDVVEAIWEGLLTIGFGDLTHPRILEPAAASSPRYGSSVNAHRRRARHAYRAHPQAAIPADRGSQSRISGRADPRRILRRRDFQCSLRRHPGRRSSIPQTGSAASDATIHNYFFVKALAKQRPGGVLAFITSRYTLDAPTAEPIRRYLHLQAALVFQRVDRSAPSAPNNTSGSQAYTGHAA